MYYDMSCFPIETSCNVTSKWYSVPSFTIQQEEFKKYEAQRCSFSKILGAERSGETLSLMLDTYLVNRN